MGIRVSARCKAIALVSVFILLALFATFGFNAYLFHRITSAATEMATHISECIIALAAPKNQLAATKLPEPDSTTSIKASISWMPGQPSSHASAECNLAISRLLYDKSKAAQERKDQACN